MANYVVEHQENGIWVPKFRCNFEDESFPKVAQNVTNRILCDGVDITSNYRSGYIPASMPQSNESHKNEEPVMKPAVYKALSQEEKLSLYNKSLQLKESKAKRVDILKALNMSEATYDTMRAEMAQASTSSEPAPAVTKPDPIIPQSVSKPSPLQTNRRAGLLGRR